MSKKLYVGNLPFSYTSEKLKELFSPYGAIEEAIIVTFKDSGRSKGFGFVTLTEDTQAEKAKQDLQNKEVDGRKLFVNDATPFDPNRQRKFDDQRRPFRRSFNSPSESKIDKEIEKDEKDLETVESESESDSGSQDGFNEEKQ